MKEDFHKISYKMHSNLYHDKHNNQKELEFYKTWHDKKTVDLWRHQRMFDVLNPILEVYKNGSWVTIGDGRYGTASSYISRKGGQVLSTDIDDTLLKVAYENEMISDYKKENAEALSFDDNAFDFSFCKEAFHHFPRPYIGLYEMIRCSKTAVILTEPKDWLPTPIPFRILQRTKNLLKKLIGLKIPHPDTGSYEEVGNYIFTISKREFQKIALGLSLPMIAFKEFHDIYVEGNENEELALNSNFLKKIKRKILITNLLSKIGLTSKNRISVVLFKKMPPENLIKKMQSQGYEVIKLPINPYTFKNLKVDPQNSEAKIC